jgi:hypothetical protein
MSFFSISAESRKAMDSCQECGAPEGTCQVRFNELLAFEFSDAGYGAVHHLTVAAYMVQHSSNLTEDGWLYERMLLRDFLLSDASPALIRKRAKHMVDNGKRTFKIKSTTGRPIFPKIKWTKTILDVRMNTAELYRSDVMDWARKVLCDSETIELK